MLPKIAQLALLNASSNPELKMALLDAYWRPDENMMTNMMTSMEGDDYLMINMKGDDKLELDGAESSTV